MDLFTILILVVGALIALAILAWVVVVLIVGRAAQKNFTTISQSFDRDFRDF